MNKKKILRAIILLVCAVFIIVAGYEIYQHYHKPVEEEAPVVETKEVVTEEVTYPDYPEVDFDELTSVNADICAYISVPGTDVAYPVLRRQDTEDIYDDYYLNVTPEGVEGLPGSIYMQPVNTGDFTEYNTVMYGHNMRNGTMFTTLHNYEDETFFEEHPYIYIVTAEEQLVFEVQAAVTYDDRHILYTYDQFASEEKATAFIQSLYDNGGANDHIREGFSYDASDRLVTLSTCTSGASIERYIVVAKLIDSLS